MSKKTLQNRMKELAGKRWDLNSSTYTFAEFDGPGQPGWRMGSEGIAYPLKNGNGQAAAYVKFFDDLKVTPKRIRRTRWLIDQHVYSWAPELRGATRKWVDTTVDGGPSGVNDKFTCAFAEAVPGETWRELKTKIVDGDVRLDDELRNRCIESLLYGLVLLERNGFVHGDLSPQNVIIDVDASPDQPALYLIDFDGFHSPQAGDLAGLSVSEGGTFGTEGYCPPHLFDLADQEPDQAVPFSDCCARDMLVLEFLCFDSTLSADYDEKPPVEWNQDLIQTKLSQSNLAQKFPHLWHADVFTRPEEQRPASDELARAIGLSTPPKIKHPRPLPRFFGRRSATGSQLVGRLEGGVRDVIAALWFLCVVHLALVAFLLSGWLFPERPAQTIEFVRSGLRMGARLLVTASAFLGGAGLLSIFAFAECEPRLVDLMGIRLNIPARRDSSRGSLAHLGIVAVTLLGVLVVLSGSALLLVRTAR